MATAARAITTGAAAGADLPLADPSTEDQASCIFCHPEAQPGALFETPLLRVVPDLYPLVPGHVLLVSRRHLRCYGEASAEELEELSRAAARVRPFLAAAYGHVLTFENGIAGQSVPHAHLHLIPAGIAEFPPDEDGWARCEGLGALPRLFAHSGAYHYGELGDDRRVLEPNGAMVWRMRALLAVAGKLRRGEDGRFHRVTTPADVAELQRRWNEHEAPAAPGLQTG
ncbi:MAG: HIT family protein [Candidatus Dormibacteria bacterium]